MISRHPVSAAEFDRLPGPGAEREAESAGDDGRRFARRTMWMEAARQCNLLSLENGLPPACDEGSGAMIDEAGALIEEELDTRVQVPGLQGEGAPAANGHLYFGTHTM